ncbi:hypothetical protein DM02DRAFT_399903 [Periconia macrospinosa]|uniref:Uncharacterized protein n=1 Tax=Periconia macrospinosa TaxID=97972 RepID=A0A2V1D0R3_9PLEO|nr:hypothetical protein DM02DRAFT_399903 [Periconia macrospinosa]
MHGCNGVITLLRGAGPQYEICEFFFFFRINFIHFSLCSLVHPIDALLFFYYKVITQVAVVKGNSFLQRIVCMIVLSYF